MGIRQEINAAILGLCKCAQAPGFVPLTGNKQVDALQNLANLHLLRGAARGFKNTIPGLVDGLVGVPAGLINGLGTGLGTKLSGGSFTEGFGEGFGESTAFAKRYYSDPIRRAEMVAGGDKVKSIFDSAQKHHQGTIEKDLGPRIGPSGRMTPDWYNYVHAKNSMDSIEGGVASGTELALSLPFYGKALTSVVSQASRAPAVAKAVGGLPKQNGWRQFAGLGMDVVFPTAHGMNVQADLEDSGRRRIDQEARRLNAVATERERLFESDRPGPFRM